MITNDPDIGISKHNPVRVGGGVLFGAFNEQQYLQRLRCANGQSPQSVRIGSLSVEGAIGPIDAYELSGFGLNPPVLLYFDVYTPGPLGVPKGFAMENPHELLLLPRTVVREFRRGNGAQAENRGSCRWRILDEEGGTLGFVTWLGYRHVDIDMPKHTGALMRGKLDDLLAITPLEHLQAVLQDYFERFLPLSSEGIVRGVPLQSQDPGEWDGPVWGEDLAKKGKKRRFWF